jgi:lincosamide nucleotidyltransferase A/C/D/E
MGSRGTREFPGGMSAGEVLAVLDALTVVGYERVWLGGGWGVDALVGRQTRFHRDLDLALDVTGQPGGGDLDEAVRALAARGYAVEKDWRPSRVELAAEGSRYVDLHPVVFDGSARGRQANLAATLPAFIYPPEGFACGVVAGRVVDCLSVDQQLRFHRGYPPRPHDLADIALLEQLAKGHA